jgi:hypothetical protein
LDEALYQSQRLTGNQDSAWRRQLLHARRHVRGSAYCRVFHAQIASHRANHHLAGVDPDSDLYEYPFAPPHFICMALHGLLHTQRGVTRAYGVILVSERGAEKSHNAVAAHLVHHTFEVMDCLYHQCQHRIEKLACFLGISVGEQLHRTLKVGEEHGDLLALPFEGTL